jgi:tRNA nucleotidyltransferase (CCA-adding enzyme)
MSEISLKALSPQSWPFDLELLPQPAFLVGGAVRDALLGRSSEYLDLDFVVLKDSVKIARKLASHYHAGFVLLDRERQIARVVFPSGTVDIAQAEGGDLLIDLYRRDFRLNAIAYNPFTKEIIDPLGGQQDLETGLINMVSAQNLRDDPLRLLRAYRQGAQLGFSIASDTLTTIQQLAPFLRQIAVERIRTELGYLLINPQGVNWLIQAWQDGLIDFLFPSANLRFSQLREIEGTIKLLSETWSTLGAEFSRYLRETIKMPLFALAKLALLASSDPVVAETELHLLKYSNLEIRGAIAIIKALPKLQTSALQMSVREQYFLFQEVRNVFPALAISAIVSGVSLEEITPYIERYLNPEDQIAHPTPLISGNDLMEKLNLPKGPQIGEMLLEIQLARIEGKITTPEEALNFFTNG